MSSGEVNETGGGEESKLPFDPTTEFRELLFKDFSQFIKHVLQWIYRSFKFRCHPVF